MTDLPATQQRDSVKQVSPPWLSHGNNERVMYNFGLADDALLEKMNQGVKARMPGVGTPSALPYIGLDRVIVQGPLEAYSSFASRLTQAFDTWQQAGSNRAVMSTVLAYTAGYRAQVAGQVPIGVTVGVTNLGTWATWDTYYNTSDLSQPPAHVSITPGNFNYNNNYHRWRAFLILFYPTGSLVDKAPAIGVGGKKIGDKSFSIGTNQPSTYWRGVRGLVRTWKSAGTYYPWIIVSFAPGVGGVGDQCSPNSVAGAGNPDGTWGQWGKLDTDGVFKAARPTTTRWVDGTGTYQQASVHTGQ